MKVRWLALLLCVVAMIAAVRTRPAQARSSKAEKAQQKSDEQEAEELLRKGTAALAAKDLANAYLALSQSYRLQPSPDTLYQLALVALEQGRTLEAQDLMQRYMADPQLENTTDSPQQKEANRVLALKRPPHGRLSILGTRGEWVTVDSRIVGVLPLSQPLLLAPGEHKVLLQTGSKQYEETIQVPAGRSVELRHVRGSGAVLTAILPAVLLQGEFVGMTAPVQTSLQQSVERKLRSEHLSIIPMLEALEVANTPQLASCAGTLICQVQLARKCQAEYALRLRAEKDATSWRFRLALVDSEVGDVGGEKDGACPDCNIEQLGTTIGESLTALLLQVQGRPRGNLQIDTTPPGAEVRAGDRLLGQTPYRGAAWEGELALSIGLRGFETQRTQLRIVDRQTATLKLELSPEVAEPALSATAKNDGPKGAVELRWQRTSRPRWRLALGGVLGGGALLMLGFGASALSIADGCLEPAVEPAAVCRQIHDTKTVGLALVGSGIALGVGAALLIALPGPRRQVPVPSSQ